MFNLLIGRALLRWAMKLGEESEVNQGETHPPDDDDLRAYPRVQRPAMGSLFEIYLAGQNRDSLIAAGEEALDQIERLDLQLSHYRDDSDIARLNAHAVDSWVRLEPRLYQLLRRCHEIWQSTGGAFDITTTALTKAWGFYDGNKRVPYDNEIKAILERTGTDKVLFDDDDNLVHFGQPGIEINLGGVGKGFAIDEAADTLRMWEVPGAVIHGGQSTIYALGDGPESDGWEFTIKDPRDHETPVNTVRLRNQALSTSGSYEDFFEVDGKRYSHILDPRTGRSVEGMLSVSVITQTAEESDALSTAFFVMGREATEEFCKKRPGLQVVMIEDSGETTEIGLT